MSVRLHDLELLDAVRDFTLAHPAAEIDHFKPAMRDWGDDWIDVMPAYLPAADRLEQVVKRADCAPLLIPFARYCRSLRWEQSYTRAQRLVPDAMLDGYGFTEVVGKQGPFVSERIRAGISILGPGIVYPRHHHRAEEIYVVLAGGADFSVGDEPATRRVSGDVVYIAPDQPHGFNTTDDIMVIFYIWQAGDLRETSTFS